MKQLSLETWKQLVSKEVTKNKLLTFFDGEQYVIPVTEWTWDDLREDVYGGENPFVKEVGYWDNMGGGLDVTSIDPEGFDYKEDISSHIFPEVKSLVDKVNLGLGGDFFHVELFPSPKVDISLTLFANPSEINKLKKQGVLPDSLLAKVLASEKTFSDFEGPLFERATVTFDLTTAPDGRDLPEPSTAKLQLPDITPKESQSVKSNFIITVKREYTDNKSVSRAFAFTFDVSDMKFKPLANGLVRPDFIATLKEYKNA